MKTFLWKIVCSKSIQSVKKKPIKYDKSFPEIDGIKCLSEYLEGFKKSP